MSPTLNGSLAIQHFKHSNVIIVGSCSPNMPQISQDKIPKLLIYAQCFDQCGLLQVTPSTLLHKLRAGITFDFYMGPYVDARDPASRIQCLWYTYNYTGIVSYGKH